jgi:uroporphyrinogen III methyltransferase/synthase
LWARADRGRDVLPELLAGQGAVLEQVVVYRHLDVNELPSDIRERLAAGELDWIALSSPSIARNWARLHARLGPDEQRAAQSVQLAAISPVTAEAARAAGLPVAVVAEEFTWAGLLTAIERAGMQPGLRPSSAAT